MAVIIFMLVILVLLFAVPLLLLWKRDRRRGQDPDPSPEDKGWCGILDVFLSSVLIFTVVFLIVLLSTWLYYSRLP